MEKRFADVQNDVFSETFAPSFPDGDLNFDNFDFDEKLEEKAGVSSENVPTKEDEAQHQEAVLSSTETKDVYTAENVEREQSNGEDFQREESKSMEKTLEEDNTASDGDPEQEGSVPGEDEEDEGEDMGKGGEPGELLMLVGCDDGFCDGNEGDKNFAEGQLLGPGGLEKPQVRPEERVDSETNEKMSYFERVPKRGSEMMIKGDGIDEAEREWEGEKQGDPSDCECEGRQIKQEENILAGCFVEENNHPCRDVTVEVSLEFPEISVQNVRDVTAEDDKEEDAEKMKDFSGEEHQEAGESFADYPSDFSSCEYMEDDHESKHLMTTQQNACLGKPVTVLPETGQAEDSDDERDECLYSRHLNAEKIRSLEVSTREKAELVKHVLGNAASMGCDDGGETGERDSYNSSDDEGKVERNCEARLMNMCPQDKNNELVEEFHGESRAVFAEWSPSDDYKEARPIHVWTRLDLLTKEDSGKEETPLSDVTQCPAEDTNTYSGVQRGSARTTSPSNLGSLGDGFLFNTELEASGISELARVGADDSEEESYWEQEQERIKVFYRFYDGRDRENRGERRQIKVQFCTNPLSQVIHYETDSSDRDSLSSGSSTDGEEDPSSAETSELLSLAQESRGLEESVEMNAGCDLLPTQPPDNVPDRTNRQNDSRTHRCLNMLQATLMMVVVTVMGLLVFWLATDQESWLSQVLFF